ncbi:4Fe-4S dicluster domain-containing protein [Candidatus Thorarchaeota archaeon]|nr:MAG: 4Fe-4S dicluster domain-containing protein [Candidatus Thorarchaeota archaeon]
MKVKKTKITIDYSKCGPGAPQDPRECRKCLYVCDPAVFLMHPTLEEHPDPWNPERWKITPVWPSMCMGCMKCIDVCPHQAIAVEPGQSLHMLRAP